MKRRPLRNSTWRPAPWHHHDPYADPPLPVSGDLRTHAAASLLCGPLLWLLLLLLCALTGCKTHRVANTTSTAHVATDSVYRSHSLVLRIDTVPVYIPSESRSATLRDTTSTLSTSVATSTASILPDGSLFHSLENLSSQPLKSPVASVSATDTLYLYRSSSDTSSDTTTHIEYVAKPLTWWETTQIYGFRILALLLLALLAIRHYRRSKKIL